MRNQRLMWLAGAAVALSLVVAGLAPTETTLPIEEPQPRPPAVVQALPPPPDTPEQPGVRPSQRPAVQAVAD